MYGTPMTVDHDLVLKPVVTTGDHDSALPLRARGPDLSPQDPLPLVGCWAFLIGSGSETTERVRGEYGDHGDHENSLCFFPCIFRISSVSFFLAVTYMDERSAWGLDESWISQPRDNLRIISSGLHEGHSPALASRNQWLYPVISGNIISHFG